MTSTELRDFLRSRRSIRRFTSAPVPDELLREILETTTFAPSAHGLQPWRFVVIDDPESRTALAAALTSRMRLDMQAENAPEAEIHSRVERSQRRISSAPKIILLCRATDATRIQTQAEELMGIQSVAMAGLQLMLAAHARGLGANWICWPLYAQQATRLALALPETWEPQGMLFVGYPAEEPKEKKLRPVEELILQK